MTDIETPAAASEPPHGDTIPITEIGLQPVRDSGADVEGTEPGAEPVADTDAEDTVGEEPASEPAIPNPLTDDMANGEDDEGPPAMCQVIFVDVVLVLPSTHPVIVLQEADPPYRELRIPIGGAEGVAIGYAARQVATPRPLTHELVARLLESFDLVLDAVQITRVEGANFVAELVVSSPTGIRSVDCRPSDGIAIALRQRIPVPIMVAPAVLEQASMGSPSGN
jgi:hypothetical protein